VATFLVSSLAYASGSPAEKEVEAALERFAEGCQQELTTYCKDVTPGEGRVLSCLYAFGDKLTTRCERSLFDSIGQLNRTVANMSYAVQECDDDLMANCSEKEVGEGRLLDCLKKNETKVSKKCTTALTDIGWWK